MKTPEQIFEENYNGFTSSSVKEAYRKGFVKGVEIERACCNRKIKQVILERKEAGACKAVL